MKLRLLSLLLALTLVLSLLPMGVAAETISYESYDFDVASNTILKYNMNVSSVTIPSEIPYGDSMVPVKTIGEEAFVKCSNLSSITIPSSVTKIDKNAFSGVRQLKSVTIQDGGTGLTIGESAFANTGIGSMALPSTTKTIGKNAFQGCSISSIAIPSGTTQIDELAFFQCSSLTFIALPSNITIGKDAFEGTNKDLVIHYQGESTDTIAEQLVKAGYTVHYTINTIEKNDSNQPTCTQEGTTVENIYCRDEKKTVLNVTRISAPLGHDLEHHDEIPSTCIVAGKTAGDTCKRPECTYDSRKTAPLAEHTWQEISAVRVEPTCQKEGTLTVKRQCSVTGCGEEETIVQTLEKTNHTYAGNKLQEKGIELIAATCTETGLELNVRLCDSCEQPEVIDEEHLKEHKDHLNDEKPWTCDEGHTTKVIPAINHKDGKSDEFKVVSGQDYDCTEGGEVEVIYKCKFCGEFVDAFTGKENLKPGDHAFGEPKRVENKCVEATCTKDGLLVTVRECTVCGFEEEEKEEVIPATGHKVSKWNEIDKATCTKVGHRSGKCTNKNCPEKDSIVIEEIEALGHDWESKDVKEELIEAATCTKEGSKYLICGRKDCDNIENKKKVVIEMIPHTPTAPGNRVEKKAPTCTAEGIAHYDTSCKVCGLDLQDVDVPIPALGHDFGPWTTSGSTRTRTCKREGCGYTETDSSTTPSEPSDPSDPTNPSTPTNTYYSVDVIRPANGSISVSTSSARADTRVTVTLRPNSGYQLDSVWVTRAGSGRNVALSGNGTNRYTFIMPASRVEVRAVFSSVSGSSTSTNTTPPNDRNTNPTKNIVINIPQISSASTPAGSRVFVDVPSTFWAQGEIAWACQRGFISGSGGNFYPNNPITVRQLWMVMARMMGQNPANMEEARVWALNNGFADGGNPNAALTRLQLATMLYRCARLMGSKNTNTTNLGSFSDSRNIPAAAKNAMAWAVANGIITGTTDGRLNPSGTVSRAQFCVILYRYYQRLF